MTITPTDLLEIERKARACQAEEAANPDAKTCQRPTPELVLRLVDEVRENKRHWDAAIRLAMKRGREISALESERDELRAKVAEMRGGEMSNSLTDKKTTGNPDLDEALDALISMMGQYCRDNEWSEKHGREMFDHQCMSAGEDASDVLIKHGWITCNNLSRL